MLKINTYNDGILSKWPYSPCLRMAERALLAGYPRQDNPISSHTKAMTKPYTISLAPAKVSRRYFGSNVRVLKIYLVSKPLQIIVIIPVIRVYVRGPRWGCRYIEIHRSSNSQDWNFWRLSTIRYRFIDFWLIRLFKISIHILLYYAISMSLWSDECNGTWFIICQLSCRYLYEQPFICTNVDDHMSSLLLRGLNVHVFLKTSSGMRYLCT